MNFKDRYLSKFASEIILHNDFVDFVSQREHSKKEYLGCSYSLMKVLFCLRVKIQSCLTVQNCTNFQGNFVLTKILGT